MIGMRRAATLLIELTRLFEYVVVVSIALNGQAQGSHQRHVLWLHNDTRVQSAVAAQAACQT
jgi:hypothetical protein